MRCTWPPAPPPCVAFWAPNPAHPIGGVRGKALWQWSGTGLMWGCFWTKIACANQLQIGLETPMLQQCTAWRQLLLLNVWLQNLSEAFLNLSSCLSWRSVMDTAFRSTFAAKLQEMEWFVSSRFWINSLKVNNHVVFSKKDEPSSWRNLIFIYCHFPFFSPHWIFSVSSFFPLCFKKLELA